MTELIFDHDRLDVYRLSIEYIASSFAVAKDLSGCHRHARDQWLRAAQSIPLNIAEANNYVCPRCGDALRQDRAGRSFIRHKTNRD